MERFRPLGDTIVVKPEEKETEINGILLPEVVQKKSKRGTVLYVGPGKTEKGVTTPLEVKPGDVVVHNYMGPGLKMNDIDVLVFPQGFVLAIVDNGYVESEPEFRPECTD